MIGCDVREGGKSLGIVKEIIDLSGNEIISVINGDREILIPMNDEILVNVDIKTRIIEVSLPDGLLELYS